MKIKQSKCKVLYSLQPQNVMVIKSAAQTEIAKSLYEYFVEKIKAQGLHCETGIFQTHMEITYTNDGPVTILLDSKNFFNCKYEKIQSCITSINSIV